MSAVPLPLVPELLQLLRVVLQQQTGHHPCLPGHEASLAAVPVPLVPDLLQLLLLVLRHQTVWVVP